MVELSRKEFLQAGGAVGAAGIVASLSGCSPSTPAKETDRESLAQTGSFASRGQKVEAVYNPETDELEINEDVIIRYGICVGCYCGCGVRLKIDRETGEILGQGGNPYNSTNAYPPLAFEEPLTEAYRTMVQAPNAKTGPATCCNRSLGNLDVYQNAPRITAPLKRAGARGEGKWETISWDQLIGEVCEGGKLFAHLGEDYSIDGYRSLCTDDLIDPEAPEFGSKRNQLVHFGGRLDGRGMTANRFYTAFGSVNQFSHLASCYGPRDLYYTCQTGGTDCSMDVDNCEYAIWCGTFPGANGGSVMGDLKRLVANMSEGKTKVVVFDPNLCNGVVTPAQSEATWHPIKPATNTALALGMARWIIDNAAYNADYLSAPTLAKAMSRGFATASNATHLVIVDEVHENYRKLMRPADAGLADSSLEPEFDEQFVVIDEGTGQPAVNLDASDAVLDFAGEVNGVSVKTAFTLFKEEVQKRTLEEYSALCEVPVEVIEETAREFTSHGTHAAIHGIGGSIALNGTDAGSIYMVLGSLIGAVQMKGGYVADYIGIPTAVVEPYSLAAIEGAPAKEGVSLARTRFSFADTSEYQRRKAAGEALPEPLLPWYDKGVTQGDNQALFSVINQYPYAAKILVTWQSNTLSSAPGAMREAVIEKLKDTNIVPLHIAVDVVEGTFARLADYIVPDLMYRETFGVQGKNQCVHEMGSYIAWPMVEPRTILLEDGRHASFDAFLCDVAEHCGLPGYGENAITCANGKTYSMRDASDYYLKAFANIALYENPVEDISEDEVHLQGLDELPESWKSAVEPEEWPKVLKVMSRGCRVKPASETYDEEGRALYGAPFMTLLYSEQRALTQNRRTGQWHSGVLSWSEETFSDQTPIESVYSREEYPFAAASYKARFRSMTTLSNSQVMQELSPENHIEMNTDDAASLGIVDGDMVDVENPSGDVVTGRALVRAGTAKGTLGIAFGYGQFANGSKDSVVDGENVSGVDAIGAGVGLVQMVDPTLRSSLAIVADPEAGTAGRNGGMFKVTKRGE